MCRHGERGILQIFLFLLIYNSFTVHTIRLLMIEPLNYSWQSTFKHILIVSFLICCGGMVKIVLLPYISYVAKTSLPSFMALKQLPLRYLFPFTSAWDWFSMDSYPHSALMTWYKHCASHIRFCLHHHFDFVLHVLVFPSCWYSLISILISASVHGVCIVWFVMQLSSLTEGYVAWIHACLHVCHKK